MFSLSEECELRGMTPERIYLLARMGNTRAALGLIIRELADIEQAVAFCKGEKIDLPTSYRSIDQPTSYRLISQSALE